MTMSEFRSYFKEVEYKSFEEADNRHHKEHNRKCIDGTITGCNNCQGYCKYQEHPGFLTEELIAIKECNEKQCVHFLAKPKTLKVKKDYKNPIKNLILQRAREMTFELEGMKVLSACEIELNKYAVRYATISNYCLTEVEQQLSHLFGAIVKMQNGGYDFDRAVQLIYG